MREKKEAIRKGMCIALTILGGLMLVSGGLAWEFAGPVPAGKPCNPWAVGGMLMACVGLLCGSFGINRYVDLCQLQHVLVQVVSKEGDDSPRGDLEGEIVFRPLSGEKDIRLWVPQRAYSRMAVGDSGTLRYRGMRFRAFRT